MKTLLFAAGAVIVSAVCSAQCAEPVAVQPLLAKLLAVGPKGEGHREAIAAWQTLAKADAAQLPEILAGMDGAGPLATNWIRAAVDTVAERALDRERLPVARLESFLADTRHAPRARRLAYEWIVRADKTAQKRLVPGMLDDPSLELRREGVQYALQQAERRVQAGDTPGAVAKYRTALDAARDLDQVNLAAGRLRELGHEVDLRRHFGFLTRWKLVGPFDNTRMTGFDMAYPPEKKIDIEATYPGKNGPVRWIDHTTDHPYGRVDLNRALGKNMGAVGYGLAEFVSDRARPAELRLGSGNANKIWLNGRLLASSEVYHSGEWMDQYTAHGRLEKGRNVILVKICQNEQTESWAQTWQFQLRICDGRGTAILPKDKNIP